MVSRKWTFQLSSSHTLPMAAPAPPSAMTVWALPSRLLQMTAVLAPASWAAMAARRPEPPAPLTRTAEEWLSSSLMESSLSSEEAGVGDGAAGHQPDVHVGQGHHHQAGPGDLH